jgi:hypothetical protein
MEVQQWKSDLTIGVGMSIFVIFMALACLVLINIRAVLTTLILWLLASFVFHSREPIVQRAVRITRWWVQKRAGWQPPDISSEDLYDACVTWYPALVLERRPKAHEN